MATALYPTAFLAAGFRLRPRFGVASLSDTLLHDLCYKHLALQLKPKLGVMCTFPLLILAVWPSLRILVPLSDQVAVTMLLHSSNALFTKCMFICLRNASAIRSSVSTKLSYMFGWGFPHARTTLLRDAVVDVKDRVCLVVFAWSSGG